jgi:hypothetical protein
MSAKKSSPTADRKAAWKQKNDSGPHKATFPTGTELVFVIPNETMLIRADKLPEHLTEIALYAAAYPDGAEGYMADVAVRASRTSDVAVRASRTSDDAVADAAAQARLKKAVKDGLELRDWLVAEMLVEPKVTPEEVAGGDFPQADIEMLIEFAERRRNVDAAGNQLPIVLLEDFARFRDVNGSQPDRESGGGDEQVVSGADAGSDGGAV